MPGNIFDSINPVASPASKCPLKNNMNTLCGAGILPARRIAGWKPAPQYAIAQLIVDRTLRTEDSGSSSASSAPGQPAACLCLAIQLPPLDV
jgi:hypothetical protein